MSNCQLMPTETTLSQPMEIVSVPSVDSPRQQSSPSRSKQTQQSSCRLPARPILMHHTWEGTLISGCWIVTFWFSGFGHWFSNRKTNSSRRGSVCIIEIKTTHIAMFNHPLMCTPANTRPPDQKGRPKKKWMEPSISQNFYIIFTTSDFHTWS